MLKVRTFVHKPTQIEIQVLTNVARTVLSSLNVNLVICNYYNESEPISCNSGTKLEGDFNIKLVDSSTHSINDNTLSSDIKLFSNPQMQQLIFKHNIV